MKKGILITVLILIIIILVIALIGGFIYMQFNKEPDIPQNAFLKINFTGTISDIDMSVIPKKLTVKDLWYHIKRAESDPRIKGIIMRIYNLNTGFATIDDIGRLITSFKKTGKKTFAFIEDGGIQEYYLASFADKVYQFKGGTLYLKGLASEAVFLKKTLSLLGVQAEFFHIGEYKTASNTFTEDKMTPAHRESFEKLLNDIYRSTLERIASNRNINIKNIEEVFTNSPISNSSYLNAHLIDGIGYEDEILNHISPQFKKCEIVPFTTYIETTSPNPYPGENRIAVVFASGEISQGQSGGQTLLGNDIMGADTITEYLRAIRKISSVKAVVLRIDSPGGASSASDAIRREVELLARTRPVIISMSDAAASGGYWISCSGTKILALPQTITGSIGVVGGKFVLKGLYDKIGISKEIVKTTENSDMYGDYRLFSPAERIQIMDLMQSLYRDFVNLVSKSRNLPYNEVDKLARGRVWAASTAQQHKLIDGIGGLNDAIELAKKMAHIPDTQSTGIITYPKKKSFLDMIFDFTSSKTQVVSPTQIIETQLNLYNESFPAFIMPYRISFY